MKLSASEWASAKEAVVVSNRISVECGSTTYPVQENKTFTKSYDYKQINKAVVSMIISLNDTLKYSDIKQVLEGSGVITAQDSRFGTFSFVITRATFTEQGQYEGLTELRLEGEITQW